MLVRVGQLSDQIQTNADREAFVEEWHPDMFDSGTAVCISARGGGLITKRAISANAEQTAITNGTRFFPHQVVRALVSP